MAGYLPKSVRRKELMTAIREVLAGGEYFPPAIHAKLRNRSTRATLNEREMTILRLIIGGRSNKEISTDLKIAEVTVKFHITNILKKLDVADRTQAAMAAISRGIVHLE
jgi:Response regulator containing a CheY-like receiver domain and an HTH DNA-binding domain